MSERNKVATKEISEEGVQILFSNEQVVAVQLSELSPEIVTQLALHGLSQKLGDSYAGVKGDAEEAVSLASAVAERLKNGEFNAKREGTGGTGKVTDLARALAEVAKKDLSEAVGRLDQMEKAEKLELRRHPRIAAVLARMAAERAAKAAEEADYLAEMDYSAAHYPESDAIACSNTAHEIRTRIRALIGDPAALAEIVKGAQG
jgi:hypothetical protein